MDRMAWTVDPLPLAIRASIYNLDLDPEETGNLWNSPDSTPIKLEMQERVMDRMAWTVDPLPMRQAPW